MKLQIYSMELDHESPVHPIHDSQRYSVKNVSRHAGKLSKWLLPAMLALTLFPFSLDMTQAADNGRLVQLQRGGDLPTVSVAIGNTETLRTPDTFVDLVVGDPNIADVMPLTNKSFYVHGKKPGTTTVSAYDSEKQLVGTIEVEVGANSNRLARELRTRIPNARIRVASINGRIELSGSVPDAPSVERAMTIARQFGPNVINSITVSQSQQVMLEVRFIEASRNAGRDLGVNWSVNGPRVIGATSGSAGSSTPFGTFIGNILKGGVTVDVLINALEQKGLGRRLAEPNLIAMSGQEASFLAGGEFPFVVPGTLGSPAVVQFKKFGVGLTFTPTVLADGMINLKIEPEVSQIDQTTSVSIGGGTVPALVVRRASTTVELRDGQSFAIAGLLQSISSDNVQQLPWLGSVPVLGALFRSQAFERKETDLAIIVTPRLVRPSPPNQRLATPLDNSRSANDVDRFILGRQEVSARQARQDMNIPPRISAGHILDMNRGK